MIEIDRRERPYREILLRSGDRFYLVYWIKSSSSAILRWGDAYDFDESHGYGIHGNVDDLLLDEGESEAIWLNPIPHVTLALL